MTQSFFCPLALIDAEWRQNIIIKTTDQGWIEDLTEGKPEQSDVVLRGTVIPGIPNLHSHAHQRAMAGLGERASSDGDSFWTWRKVMYHCLRQINPDHLQAIASQLYVEMLKAGFTSVAEFQYLHHDPEGNPYANPAEMTLRCREAALESGIGFTALPVLYRFGGFGSQPAEPSQFRFINDQDSFLEILRVLDGAMDNHPDQSLGIAPHSLRAVSQQLLQSTLDAGTEYSQVTHIHIAEQTREVEQCVEWSGQCPVQWLLDRFDIKDWCLVHATHMTDEETRAVAESDAIVGLCPTTEANLGDGFFNSCEYLQHGGVWGIGSDSQISISPVEELRWLEYGQRLLTRKRNIYVDETTTSVGRHLLNSAWLGGARALARKVGRLSPGLRADFICLDDQHPRLVERKGDQVLDSWIFSGNELMVSDVVVGGKQVVEQGRHQHEDLIRNRFSETLKQLAASEL